MIVKNRVTAGSSGGTAAAVAAGFGTVGLGTDTGNSIRGPSSHNCLVGIRSTMGLTSRDGIIPLYLDRDIGGPMARTVADAVAVFQVIAGYDPADPAVVERFEEALAAMRRAGATVVDSVTIPELDMEGPLFCAGSSGTSTRISRASVPRRRSTAWTALSRRGASIHPSSCGFQIVAFLIVPDLHGSVGHICFPFFTRSVR